MKVTLENTTKIVTVNIDGHDVPARIWEGETENGVKCHAFITRIAVHKDDDCAEFEKELQECKGPSAEIDNIPMRMIL